MAAANARQTAFQTIQGRRVLKIQMMVVAVVELVILISCTLGWCRQPKQLPWAFGENPYTARQL
jgi:hypothetical protein